MFYTSLESMMDRFERSSRKMRMDLSSSSSFTYWQKRARNKLLDLLCLDKLSFSDSEPVLLETLFLEGIRREKWIMEVEPNVQMPFYVLIPSTAKDDTPQYICAPGHLGGGKESLVGNDSDPRLKGSIETYGYDYALLLARLGFVSIAFDPRGFGERRERDDQKDDLILKSSCYQLSHMAESLGLTLCGLLVHDIMALVNQLEKWNRWGEIRALGFSGGGLQVLYASALDERIKASFISGYFYGFKDSLLELNGNCSCNYVPSLYLYFDMGDLGAMIAPRPLVVQSARGDHLAGKRGIVNVLEPMDEVKAAYGLLGSEDKIFHHIVDGPHHFEKENLLEVINRVC